MNLDVLVRGGTVVLPEAGAVEADVAIRGERVAALLDPATEADAAQVIDATGKLVLPGLVDPHVHIGYEGYAGMPLDALADHFATESATALVGGVTTVMVTYRNAEPYEDIFDQMRLAGETRSRVDFGYSLGITNDLQAEGIAEYYRRFGVSSFKFYMAYKGEDAAATGNVYNRYDDGLFYAAIERIAQLPGAMAMVHPENAEIISFLRGQLERQQRNDLAAWTESRPGFVEAESIRRAAFLCEQVGCSLYLPHVSCRESLRVVAEHRARNTTPVHVETCPHYLTHSTDAAEGCLVKVNPPVRGPADRDALWAAIADGAVDTCGTDHCGVSRQAKGTDIWRAVPGFSGMATMLPVLMTGVHERRIPLERVPQIASARTARIFNLYPRKGTLQVGSDADLVIVDPQLRRRVRPTALRSRSDFSIYEDWDLTGWPVLTVARGRVAMRDGDITVDEGRGRYLRRVPTGPYSSAARQLGSSGGATQCGSKSD